MISYYYRGKIYKMRFIVLGSTGLLGSYIFHYLTQKLNSSQVISLNRDQLDLDNLSVVKLREKLIELIQEDDWVINCIGCTNKLNIGEESIIKINVLLPHLLANICENKGAKLIHPSTDCVFDGLKGEPYEIIDTPNGKDLYGISKYLGEPKNQSTLVIRTSIIGEGVDGNKSLLNWIKKNKNKKVSGYENHLWNGITCLEYAKLIYNLSLNRFTPGTYHYYSTYRGQDHISKSELIKEISRVYNLNIDVSDIKTPIKVDRRMKGIKCEVPLKKQIDELYVYDILSER